MFGVTESNFECSVRHRKVDIDLCRKNNLLHYSKRSCNRPTRDIFSYLFTLLKKLRRHLIH